MSTTQARKDEIQAKKARLAELKKQRELRQKEFSSNRQSVGGGEASEVASPSPLRVSSTNRADLDSLISSLVDRPPSAAPGTPSGKASRPASLAAPTPEDGSKSPLKYADAATDTQTLSFTAMTTVYEIPVEPKPEVINYSKGVQTSEPWSPQRDESSGDEAGLGRSSSRKRKRQSQRDEELRQQLRQEIEDELKALKLDEDIAKPEKERFPSRSLNPEELNVVTSSNDFLDFVERSSKVIERALDEEYDVLADYALRGALDQDEDDDYVGRKGRRIREVCQFEDERLTKRRMVSDIDFSSKFPELLCTAYTKSQQSPHAPPGLICVWNTHLRTRPEYTLTATSDLLSAQFHPHHPNILIGGTYSGQLCLWDTRHRSHTGAPVQRTPLSGGRSGHAHPIYSLAVVGTQNASSIVSVSTDGTVCAWSIDMLTTPQEYLELHAAPPSKTEDIAPTCISFPASDPTYFLAGTEQGNILPVHRYDRAGAKAGVDNRVVYQGHAAPVMALDFHPSRGKIDLGDLAVSCGLDWSVKVWRAKPPSSTAGSITGGLSIEKPLLDIAREDVVYDVKWSPTKPGVFGAVDGAGHLDVFDMNDSTEVPVGSAQPSNQLKDVFGAKSLNKLAFEKQQGKHVAVGGLDGITTVFEVGSELGGLDTKGDSWVGIKKTIGRLSRTKVAEAS